VLIGYLRDPSGDNAHAAAHRRTLFEAGCERVVEERLGREHDGDQPKLRELLASLQASVVQGSGVWAH